MNVVDSCAWLEYFADGPKFRTFSLRPSRRGQASCLFVNTTRVVRPSDQHYNYPTELNFIG